MIRHSNSLFLSIIIHSLLLSMIIIVYNYIPDKPQPKEEHKHCIKLCNVVEKKVEPIIQTKPIKKEIVQPKPKPKPKPIKKEVKPQIIVKKKILVVKDEPIKEKIEVKKEPEPVVEPKTQEVYTKPLPTEIQESLEDINARKEQEYIDENIAKIRSLIKENLYYPRSARKRGIVGEVVVKFVIAKDASVHSINIVSSESEILSRAAVKTIQNISSDFPKPDDELILHVPISYKLD